jgi:hypothetical protein
MSRDFSQGQRKFHNLHDLIVSELFEYRKSGRQAEHNFNHEQVALIILGHILFQLVGAALLEQITACFVTLGLKHRFSMGMKMSKNGMKCASEGGVGG